MKLGKLHFRFTHLFVGLLLRHSQLLQALKGLRD
jgi:hypothetical protein